MDCLMPYVIEDRGFGECWMAVHFRTGEPLTRFPRKRFLLAVPRPEPGYLFQHICEVADVPNRCVNPDHVFYGTRSSNFRHSLELHGGRMFDCSEETRIKASKTLRGRRKSTEHKEKIRAALKGMTHATKKCHCGRDITVSNFAKHQRACV